RPLRRPDEAGVEGQGARSRQAAFGPRLPPPDGVLSAARRRGADDRAHRDRDQGDPRRFRRRDRGDSAGGSGGSRDRAQRPLHDARAPPRRSGGGQATGHPRGRPVSSAGRSRARARSGHAPRDNRSSTGSGAPARIFSGIQPTGRKHLGNYLGAIVQYVAAQERGEAIFCIVDLHAITVAYEPAELRERCYDTPAILLAAGPDPSRCTLFRQSDVPQHTELTWLLSSVTELGRLMRMHQFRDKSAAQRELVSAGLLLYPVLQAADVLAYRAREVPVGEDQREHLELMRDVARRFNARFGGGEQVL